MHVTPTCATLDFFENWEDDARYHGSPIPVPTGALFIQSLPAVEGPIDDGDGRVYLIRHMTHEGCVRTYRDPDSSVREYRTIGSVVRALHIAINHPENVDTNH